MQQEQSKPDLGSSPAEAPKEKGPAFSAYVIALSTEGEEAI